MSSPNQCCYQTKVGWSVQWFVTALHLRRSVIIQLFRSHLHQKFFFRSILFFLAIKLNIFYPLNLNTMRLMKIGDFPIHIKHPNHIQHSDCCCCCFFRGLIMCRRVNTPYWWLLLISYSISSLYGLWIFKSNCIQSMYDFEYRIDGDYNDVEWTETKIYNLTQEKKSRHFSTQKESKDAPTTTTRRRHV